MAETFTLSGSYSTSGQTPTCGSSALSMDALIAGTIVETMSLQAKRLDDYPISTDSVVTVAFGALTEAHVVLIKTTDKVSARLTSADGALQIVPVDGVLIIISDAVPFTAIDLQRVAGAAALTARVFLGEKNT